MQRPMNRAKTAAMLLVVFFAGCAAERLLVVPPARAETNPQRWEYACFKYFDIGSTTEKANEFGAQGWEMVSASNVPWCFKRPLP
jgi:hypothetical protein